MVQIRKELKYKNMDVIVSDNTIWIEIDGDEAKAIKCKTYTAEEAVNLINNLDEFIRGVVIIEESLKDDKKLLNFMYNSICKLISDDIFTDDYTFTVDNYYNKYTDEFNNKIKDEFVKSIETKTYICKRQTYKENVLTKNIEEIFNNI